MTEPQVDLPLRPEESRAEAPASDATPRPGRIGKSIAKLRDWRIDIDDPLRSVAFATTGRVGAQLAPVSAIGSGVVDVVPCFVELARAIRAHVALLRERQIADGLRRATDFEVPATLALTVDGTRCRVQHVSPNRFHVRVTHRLIDFSRLGMPKDLESMLLSGALNQGGLVVVCGGYGSGKTSTVNSTIRARVEKWGGYALVMASPIEYDFAGFHGSQARPGYVEQIDLAGLDVAAEIRRSMRNFPSGATSILGYPELIGHEGCAEMLRHANRGNLVFADMHAINPAACLLNLVSMAESDGERHARQHLANSLRLIVHQSVCPDPNSPHGMRVAFESVEIDRTRIAALMDEELPLARVLQTMGAPGELARSAALARSRPDPGHGD